MKNHNNNWTDKAISSDPFPNRYIWDIATLPDNNLKLVVVVSGFGTPHVFYGEIQTNDIVQWLICRSYPLDGLALFAFAGLAAWLLL